MLIFEDFLPLKGPLVTTLNDMRALSSGKYVLQDTKNDPKQFKPYKLLWLHSSVFVLDV